MQLMRYNPLLKQLNQWPDFFDDDGFMSTASNNLDVYETDDQIVVKANVAGVNPDQVDITFEKGTLWIKAEKQEEKEDKKKQHYSKSSWNYSYRVSLPNATMLDHNTEPTADVDNGVVTITFKKTEASKPKKLTVKKK